MKLYSYVIASDAGFAPNPNDGWCTLACCKPNIRLSARKGDFVVGTGSAAQTGNNTIVYIMHVDEKLTFDEFFKDARFQNREDNIYHSENGHFIQSSNSNHDCGDIERDLSCKHVLISGPGHFSYFGRKAIPIPEEFRQMVKKGPGHKCNFEPAFLLQFVSWAQLQPKGKIGESFEKSSFQAELPGPTPDDAQTRLMP
jgi:hypothetical protein